MTDPAGGKRLATAARAAAVSVDMVVSPDRPVDDCARAVAEYLGRPMGRLVTTELRAPDDDALLGAVASDGSVWFDDSQIEAVSLSHEDIRDTVVSAHELARERARSIEPADCSLAGKNVLIVDSERTTDATVMVAIRNCRAARAETVSVIVEHACGETLTRYHREADDVICLRPSGEPELETENQQPPSIRR